MDADSRETGERVVEAAPAFCLNVPRDHPLHLGFAAEPWLDDADLVLVAACDVPWAPRARRPPRTRRSSTSITTRRRGSTVPHVGLPTGRCRPCGPRDRPRGPDGRV